MDRAIQVQNLVRERSAVDLARRQPHDQPPAQEFGDTTGSTGVFAQRFSAEGNPTGIEFHVNSNTSSSQFDPAVAATADSQPPHPKYQPNMFEYQSGESDITWS